MMKWFLAVLAIFVLIAFFDGSRREKLSIQSRFSGRNRLDLKEICNLFDKDNAADRELLLEILDFVAGEFHIDKSLLRPEDRFDEELKPVKGWEVDCGTAMLFAELSGEAQKRGITLDWPSIKTLDDYLKVMLMVCQQNK